MAVSRRARVLTTFLFLGLSFLLLFLRAVGVKLTPFLFLCSVCPSYVVSKIVPFLLCFSPPPPLLRVVGAAVAPPPRLLLVYVYMHCVFSQAQCDVSSWLILVESLFRRYFFTVARERQVWFRVVSFSCESLPSLPVGGVFVRFFETGSIQRPK